MKKLKLENKTIVGVGAQMTSKSTDCEVLIIAPDEVSLTEYLLRHVDMNVDHKKFREVGTYDRGEPLKEGGVR